MNVTINLAVVLTQAKFDARVSVTDWHIVGICKSCRHGEVLHVVMTSAYCCQAP